ncbi:MAG: SufD family Fe-S cluster assembly protein [Oscillospiraceae bacterium]|nr:SufD family Fe-S cluster assembly protein [Oscillospiraceae bacterium]
MGIKKIKVNKLPSVTWHWTGMNDADLDIDLSGDAPLYTLRGQSEGMRWIDDLNSADGRMEEILRRPGWEQTETGMGTEFADAMRETPGALLDIPEGDKGNGPVVITAEARDGRCAGQILIRAGAGSDSDVVVVIGSEKQTGTDQDTVAVQILIQTEMDADLRLFVVQDLPQKGISCLNLGGVCGERAKIEWTHLSLGAGRAFIGAAMELSGDDSVFHGETGYRVRSGQNVDINYVCRHCGRRSVSNLNAWGVLEDGSVKLFRGTIDFHEGCSGSVGAEKEDVLLLGKNQINKTIPLILCHEEDVEGDHGATISRLDEQMLFYLASRGLDAGYAENMIARARLDALCEKIPDSEIRSEAEKKIRFEPVISGGIRSDADGRSGEGEDGP